MLGQVKDSAKPPRPLLAAVLLVGKSWFFFFPQGKKDGLDKSSLYIVYRLTADVG